MTSFPPIEDVFARVRPRPNAFAVVAFRPQESASALAAVVGGAVSSLPAKGTSTASPFSSAMTQGVLVTCEAPKVDPLWARRLQGAIEETIGSATAPIMGIGFPMPGQNFRNVLTEAFEALRIGRELNLERACVSRDDVLAFELLNREPQVSLALASVLAPITLRERRPNELIRTLEVYLDAGLSIAKTASRLNVHRHTVDNRIARIEKSLARSLERQGDRLVVELALQARHLESGKSSQPGGEEAR